VPNGVSFAILGVIENYLGIFKLFSNKKELIKVKKLTSAK
jgi:hypothetical protein